MTPHTPELSVRRLVSFLGAALALCGTPGIGAQPPPAEAAEADVVLVVDTSDSMTDPGMDPERTSLLVSRLFADIVPGDLAVVRLHDPTTDGEALGTRPTGRQVPCGDDGSKICNETLPAENFQDLAREARIGALQRPRRADPKFKEDLEAHLEPTQNHSQFQVAFRSAQGVLESHGDASGRTRTVVWLSDGRPDDPELMEIVTRELRASGTRIEAILFGAGDPAVARRAGFEVRQAATPRALMAAFTDVFRGIVEAPYGIDGRIDGATSFEIEPNVDEAWVVVYGDASLRSARLEGPGGSVEADHGAGRHDPAGAYRVAYLRRPAAGTWSIEAAGGGPETVFSVIQRSALAPVLLGPETAVGGTPTRIVAGIRSGPDGELVTSPQVLSESEMTIEIGGRTLSLRDDGTNGDETAGDGRFSVVTRLEESGEVPVRLRLATPLVDRAVDTTVEVAGSFTYTGGPVAVDLGSLRSGQSSCRPLRFIAEHEGTVPMELRAGGSAPSGHRFEVRGKGLDSPIVAGSGTAGLAPSHDLEICLVTERSAPSSRISGSPPFTLAMAGSDDPHCAVPIALSWEVTALTLWERWWRWILGILGLLVAAAIVAGYVLPHRFSGTLALSFVSDRRDLDDQLAQPIKQWKGVGAGFYRNARAFLHADYRISGKPRGALAGLHAESRTARVMPSRGSSLFRETIDGDWETVPAAGRPIRPGDVYRVGEGGPFFRVGSRR